MSDKKLELIKMIQDNPELSLLFINSNEDVCYGYGSTVYENYDIKIGTLYFPKDDELVYEDKNEIEELYRDRFCDKEEYKDLSDEEYEKAISEYVEENIRHYKAIIVTCFN